MPRRASPRASQPPHPAYNIKVDRDRAILIVTRRDCVTFRRFVHEHDQRVLEFQFGVADPASWLRQPHSLPRAEHGLIEGDRRGRIAHDQIACAPGYPSGLASTIAASPPSWFGYSQALAPSGFSRKMVLPQGG
jgi:hypothetical protein